jgi:hypothetical protein
MQSDDLQSLTLLERTLPLQLPVLTAAGAGIWGLFVYLGDQAEVAEKSQREAEAMAIERRIKAQEPFLKKQLELFFETARTVGRSSHLVPDQGCRQTYSTTRS